MKNNEQWWKTNEKMKNDEKDRKQQCKNDEKIEKNNEHWWKREKTPMKNDEADRKKQ